MYQYKELSGLTRATIATLWIFMICKGLVALGQFYAMQMVEQPPARGLVLSVGLVAILDLIALIVTVILVGCCIYRASANAHGIAGGLAISPGWAVGWYFIPLANLFQPYIAMKEIWLASHYHGDLGAGEATPLLPWWWGLWILSGIMGELVVFTRTSSPGFSAEAGLASAGITVALTLILILIIKQIRDAQGHTRHAEIFA